MEHQGGMLLKSAAQISIMMSLMHTSFPQCLHQAKLVRRLSKEKIAASRVLGRSAIRPAPSESGSHFPTTYMAPPAVAFTLWTALSEIMTVSQKQSTTLAEQLWKIGVAML